MQLPLVRLIKYVVSNAHSGGDPNLTNYDEWEYKVMPGTDYYQHRIYYMASPKNKTSCSNVTEVMQVNKVTML